MVSTASIVASSSPVMGETTAALSQRRCDLLRWTIAEVGTSVDKSTKPNPTAASRRPHAGEQPHVSKASVGLQPDRNRKSGRCTEGTQIA
ncbi:hypothetical protein J6590_084699 [Homalodisca vitripennis]|nr:hypothetical protein J6590_084699 [Homalodisca vitripennis]